MSDEHCDDCGAPLPYFSYGGRVIRIACDCRREVWEKERRQLADAQTAATLRNRGFETGLYRSMTLERWQDRGIEVKIHAYIDGVRGGGKNWLYLHGPYGLGKTHIAVAAARQLAYDRGWGPALIRWAEYCSKIQQSWTDKGIQGDWQLARSCKLLVLDDLDKKDATRWSLGQLFELIDYRYTAQAPTIFTANRPIKELSQRWMTADPDAAKAIISRIVGQLNTAVAFKGPDFRLSGRAT